MLRPQDILVLLKIATAFPAEGGWRQKDLADALSLSPAEIHKALRRCADARLYAPVEQRVHRQALAEFVVHGLKYVFPAKLGEPTRGIPTAWAAPPLAQVIRSGDQERPVWPWAEGTHRGVAVLPLYATAPGAALADQRLYELLALIDGIRIGRARERKIAAEEIERRLVQR